MSKDAYTIDRTFENESFDAIVERTRTALADQGFGVLTEIDVKATMKKKIDADMDNYLILGACNPTLAYHALQTEPQIGAMLPCNVIVRSIEGGKVQVGAIDPVSSMQAVDNSELTAVAGKVRDMLEPVVSEI